MSDTMNADIHTVVTIMQKLDDRNRWKLLGYAEELEQRYAEAVQLASELVQKRKPAPSLSLVSATP